FTFQQAVIIEDPTPLYGDVNEDTFVGKTDDIVLLAKYLSNGIKLSETALANANCDMGDTRINASDLQAIVNYLLNDISSLPVE
ncbi:MAG: dockerin type I repeat-containing protein, partial [Oscillospiraceae bacterium]|nr:dockerin type I repeat-containing protein [Oscillospiraceae bacterium]